MAFVRLLPAALRQVYDLQQRWSFNDEWGRAVKRLETTPRIAPPYLLQGKSCHRLLLRGCQVHVYYFYDEPTDEVVVFLLRSTRQKPL